MQVEAQRQELAKLQSENSILHQQLILAKENSKSADSAVYQETKRLEDKVAELTFWKQAAADKQRSLEKENAQLRNKVQELVSMTDQLSAGISRYVSS